MIAVSIRVNSEICEVDSRVCFGLTSIPVSYTHLDVYKRQA
ncbi:hypothetical protein [Erwinia amylovora]